MATEFFFGIFPRVPNLTLRIRAHPARPFLGGIVPEDISREFLKAYFASFRAVVNCRLGFGKGFCLRDVRLMRHAGKRGLKKEKGEKTKEKGREEKGGVPEYGG